MKTTKSAQWQYFEPVFEHTNVLHDIETPWAGHRYFVYDLIRNIKPKTIVELGTFHGTSFFSMCQALKDGKLKSAVYAVDTWKGDKHAGFYEEKIYQDVVAIRAKYFKKVNSTLLRKTFDEALSDFKDKTIDLLHIDGLHTYKAVKHDFESWLPKMSANGVIIMHDIVERQADFGVYKLWTQIKKKYTTAEFHHSHGLGVVVLNKKLQGMFTQWREPWLRYYGKVYDFDRDSQRFLLALREHDNLVKDIAEKEKEIILLRHDLHSITSTKFFKFWQQYVKLKNTVLVWKSPTK